MRRPRTYKSPHRRRREGKTNYRKRLNLLKAGLPRLVIRKSTNNVTCQVVNYKPTGDQTVVTTNAVTLKGVGWKAGTGSVPAAYLIGFLCGTAAKKKGVSKAIADLGMTTPTKWSRLFAAVKGAVDAGLEVPHSEDVMPPAERILGKHISAYAEKLKKDTPEKYQALFSKLAKAIPIETLAQHVEEVKKKASS